MSSNSSTGYQFTLQNGVVSAISEIKNGRTKLEKIDANETWSYNAVTKQVTKVELEHGRTETTVYADGNGDGIFNKISSNSVATTPSSANPLNSASTTSGLQDGYQFTLVNGVVTAVAEVEHGRIQTKTLEFGTTWSVSGAQVIKTEIEHGQIETTVYADLNADGIFNKLSQSVSNNPASASTNGVYQDDNLHGETEHHVTLTGIPALHPTESGF